MATDPAIFWNLHLIRDEMDWCVCSLPVVVPCEVVESIKIRPAPDKRAPVRGSSCAMVGVEETDAISSPVQ